MKYYRMSRLVRDNGTSLYQRSHDLTELKTGRPLGNDFEGPLVVELDKEFIDGEMPTFYESPAVIGTKRYCNDLLEIGVSNIESYPVIINDEVHHKVINDYVLLNFIGRVSCVDMERSEYGTLGDGMNIIDRPVLVAKKIPKVHLFLIHEDTDCIVVDEKVFNHLQLKGYTDIFFEELEQT